jgi:hypothetical protein
MKWNTVFSALVVSASLCGQSFGFELLDRMLGLNDCGCNTCCSTAAPACGCDKGCGPSNYEPACNAAVAAACEPGCAAAAAPCSCTAAAPACEAACSAAGPTSGCAAPAAPSCGCAAPACGSTCGGCNKCCRPGLFQGMKGLFDCAFPCLPVIVFEPICHRNCCNSGCAAAVPACGAATASCGAPACGSCQKPCLLDCFRIKHKCCARNCGNHHHCGLFGGSSCGAVGPSCGCAAAAPSCGYGDTGVPAATAPAEDAYPMPPAPTVDPSASYQKNRVLSVSSRTASLN